MPCCTCRLPSLLTGTCFLACSQHPHSDAALSTYFTRAASDEGGGPSYERGLALMFYNSVDEGLRARDDCDRLETALDAVSAYNTRTYGRGSWDCSIMTASGMLGRVRSALRSASSYDAIIVLFSGHGCLPADDVRYVDGVCQEEDGSACVPMRSIMTAVTDSAAFSDAGKHKLFIYDACRRVPLCMFALPNMPLHCSHPPTSRHAQLSIACGPHRPISPPSNATARPPCERAAQCPPHSRQRHRSVCVHPGHDLHHRLR